MSDKILFVDDDRYFARLYKEELEKVYGRDNVVVSYDAETASHQFDTNGDIVAAVVDVMMPPPEGQEAVCHDGNSTGIWILAQSQETIRRRRIALLLFTNRAVGHVKEEIQFMMFDTKITEVHSKLQIPSAELPAKVGLLISRR